MLDDPASDPLNPRARPHVQVLEVRRPASGAYLTVWADCGCRWRDGGVFCVIPRAAGCVARTGLRFGPMEGRVARSRVRRC